MIKANKTRTIFDYKNYNNSIYINYRIEDRSSNL